VIRSLFLAVSRSLFQLAALLFVVAGIVLYISWRFALAAVYKEKAQPVRDAIYGVLTALVHLVQATAKERTP
jgi:hypothetical protein